MQRFIYSKGARSQWLAFPVICVFGVIQSSGSFTYRIQNHTMDPNTLVALGTIFGLFGVLPVIGWFLSGRQWFEADENEILFHGLRGETRMQWREVEAVKGGSTSFATVRLTDHRNRTITIPFGSLENRGKELRALLDSQLGRLLERRAQEFKNTAVKQAGNTKQIGYLLAGIGALLVVLGAGLAASGPANGALAPALVVAFFGLLLAVLGMLAGSREFQMDDEGITQRWAFGAKTIRYADITSVYTVEGNTNNGPFEAMTIKTATTRIMLSSQLMSNYSLMRDRVMGAVPPEVITTGNTDRQKLNASQYKQATVIVIVCVAVLWGMGFFFAKNVYERYAFAKEVQARGVFTNAKVIGDSCNCGNDTLQQVRLLYTVNGQSYTVINRRTVQTLGIHLRDVVPIYYLPENPGRALLKVRLDPSPLLGDMVMPLIFLLATPLLIPLMLRGIRKQMQQQADSQKA